VKLKESLKREKEKEREREFKEESSISRGDVSLVGEK
jgi:NACalpha-BTF3-like transcription factor